MSFHSPQQSCTPGLIRRYLSQQETMPCPTTTLSATSSPSTVLVDQTLADQPTLELPVTTQKQGKKVIRAVVLVAAATLVCTLYLIWRVPTATVSPDGIAQAGGVGPGNIATVPVAGTASSVKTATDSTGDTGGTIQVYIVGAVKNPGVYTLPGDARVYQLLQAAGGPVAGANLKAINLAAKLNDGQEVYVAVIGETPNSDGSATNTAVGTGAAGGSNGQLININSANADTLRQGLHTTSSIAQAIVNYRTQHGPYTSVDELANVVSKTVYNRIKSEVTV